MNRIAVLDTETNWDDRVMSLGIAVADSVSFQLLDCRYYVISPEWQIGGMYSDRMRTERMRGRVGPREAVLKELSSYLRLLGVTSLFAYNARFDCGHLPELNEFSWYDLMNVAIYRQFNAAIPADADCYKTGRLKHNRGVEPMMRLLTGDPLYRERHNALDDAVDELTLMRLLGQPLRIYEKAKLN